MLVCSSYYTLCLFLLIKIVGENLFMHESHESDLKMVKIQSNTRAGI